MAISPAYDALLAMLNSTEGEKAYLAWISHPVTAMFISAGRELARPRAPASPAEFPLALGESLGANNILDVMVSPIGRAADRMRGVMPPVRYGVRPATPESKGDE